MSYDLYLFSPKLTAESVNLYFANRAHYKDDIYQNENTGVYFRFDYNEPDADEDDEEFPPEAKQPHVAFNLNYFRPHIFGLEAEREVAAFVAEFDCSIFDPQLDGMGEGPYSSEGFLRGWNAGNAFGCRAVVDQGGGKNVLRADDALIESVWRWNLNVQSSRNEAGDGYFVPRLSWAAQLDGTPVAFAVWGEGVPIAIPQCATHALLAREPRRGLFGSKKEGMEVKLVPLASIACISGCAWRDVTTGRVLLAPATLPPSKEVRDLFKSGFGEFASILKPYSVDTVLNASLLASAGNAA